MVLSEAACVRTHPYLQYCGHVELSSPSDHQALVFGAVADQYERSRPSYPLAGVDWLLAGTGPRVLELGAGTGKMTRLLRDRSREVVAVEPSARMRAVLMEAVPQVSVLAGAAENIPLPDKSVNVVVVAQAWHWVDASRAVGEIARVLTDGGRLGLVWNVRDERRDWVRQLGRLLAPHTHKGMNTTTPQVGPPFGVLERLEIEWEHPLDRQGVLDLVSSRSYVISLPSVTRSALLADVTDLLRTNPDLQGQGQITIPYISRCYRATV